MIIDVTPQLLDHPTLYRRQSEIERWLMINNRASEPWVAIDDKLYLYREEAELDLIVATNDEHGLTKKSAEKLERKLKQIPHTIDLFKNDLP